MQPTLNQLAESLASAGTLEQLSRPLLEMLEEVTGLESTYLTEIDESLGIQHIVYARNSSQLQIPEGLSVPWEDTLCKRALEEGRTYTDDVAGCWGDSEAARVLGIKTYVSTPVWSGQGKLFGTLCAASSAQVPLSPGAEKILGLFAKLLGQHVERERLLAQVQATNAELAASALTDSLTGLPNRRATFEEGSRMLARATRENCAVVVGFIDLDDFKSINDRHGHAAGDEFLRAIGAKLVAAQRAGDLVARFGGDEFLVLSMVPHANVQGATEAMRNRLGNCLAGRYHVGGNVVEYGGASIGIASGGSDGATLDTLVRQADAAMYAHKQARQLAGARH